jgi:fatty-acyl-CoA synthase
MPTTSGAVSTPGDLVEVTGVGQPDPDWGETVVAVVAIDGEDRFDLSQLRAHCAPLIADYKIPRKLVFGDVPRIGAGKIQKHLINRELFNVRSE